MNAFDTLKNTVINSGLCVHCGTCAGVCPVNVLDFDDILGKCDPVLVGKCIDCGWCLKTCPGKTVDYFSPSKQRTDLKSHPLLGQFSKIFVGHSKDKNIRRGGASGGMVTTILLHLLEQKEVDGAVVLDFSDTKPWFPKVKIVSERTEIIKAAQSKYFIYPQNKILNSIRESTANKIAYVGLPCQIHGIKKAIQQRIPGTEKIKYVLGIYCGNNLYYGATLSLFKRFGFADLSQIKRIAYREGYYPGHFVVEGKNAKRGRVDKFLFNYLSFFFTPLRCLFCIDLTSEFADLSIGDGWRGVYSEDNIEGRSILVVRNHDLLPILEQGMKGGHYWIEEILDIAAVHMHANVLDNKKVGAHARMNIWSKLGRDIPEYSVTKVTISPKRYVLEAANLLLLGGCSQKLSRRFSSIIPLTLMSPLIKFVRGYWRKKAAKKLNKI